MEERFFYCESCNNVLIAAIASGVIPYCCGDEMTLLKPNTSDGNVEKHVPVVAELSDHSIRVKIGSEPHPMTAAHNIRFICLQTTKEIIIRYLNVSEAPDVTIQFCGNPLAIYAYCNLHGLWQGELNA